MLLVLVLLLAVGHLLLQVVPLVLEVMELALVVLLILLVVVVVVVVLDRRGRDGRMMGRPSDERRAHVERGRPVDRLDAGRRRRRRLQRWRHPLLHPLLVVVQNRRMR